LNSNYDYKASMKNTVFNVKVREKKLKGFALST